VLVLGIETSCDETAAAIVRGRTVLSDVIQSQIILHAEYGGVVPEIAARDHLTKARPVIEAAIEQARVELRDIDAIAVTCRPGLSGALLIGTQVASALAFAMDRPLVGVDHLVGHILAAFLEFPGIAAPPAAEFPFVALLASGGHTALYRVDGPDVTEMTELGATRDDAAGEAYDKVAKLLGLGYPGGPIIDQLASEGDPEGVDLARPMAERSSLEFSFSRVLYRTIGNCVISAPRFKGGWWIRSWTRPSLPASARASDAWCWPVAWPPTVSSDSAGPSGWRSTASSCSCLHAAPARTTPP
jgi:N6-L-threonylcarbamoyladenine synthase